MITFTITGPPRTKKNSEVLNLRGPKPRKMPSKAYREWNASAQLQLAKVRSEYRNAMRPSLPWIEPVNVTALIYRETLTGDANGFYQAIADTLQEGRIVLNDSLIVSWDGSRLRKDGKNPRVEITITVAEE